MVLNKRHRGESLVVFLSVGDTESVPINVTSASPSWHLMGKAAQS
jgi:hypothetical protein